MANLSALIDGAIQDRLDEVLASLEVPDRTKQLADNGAKLSLAVIGSRPPALRTAAIALISHGERVNLIGAGLLAAKEGDRPRWVLTKSGEKVADAFAAAVGDPLASTGEDPDFDARLAAARREARELASAAVKNPRVLTARRKDERTEAKEPVARTS
jgi:hypothetical protein